MFITYKDFILESLILESKLEFSDKLKNLLKSIPNNKIKEKLLKLSDDKKDLPYVQNYLDVSDKEEISFIQNRRAQTILSGEQIKWITGDASNKYLTFNRNEYGVFKNKSLFDALGFYPEGNGEDNPPPGRGKIGDIISEVLSPVSGKTFVLFKWHDGDKERLSALNKVCLEPHDDRWVRLWTQGRNPIRVGRLVRSLLNVAKEKYTDQEIEEFVNLYKSTYDIINDALLKFDVVSGKDIAFWYNMRNYENGGMSTLGSSCMAEVDDNYFDIYVSNPEVCSLVILYGEEGGNLVDGKWKGTKIRGRALLWKTDQGDMFMDRIYYNRDSDVELFKQYAIRNNWWYKKFQDSGSNFVAYKGVEYKEPIYTVSLKKSTFDEYPYVDTLNYLNFDDDKMSNSPAEIDANADLCSTSGGYDDMD